MSDKADWIFGRIPVYELLRAQKRKVISISVAKDAQEKGALASVISLAQQSSIPVKRVPKSELDSIHSHHQGIVAHVEAYPYATVNDVLNHANIKEECECTIKGCCCPLWCFCLNGITRGQCLKACQ